MSKLTIMRGLPGTDKSTLARTYRNASIYSTDDYFVTPEGYKYDPQKASEAHKWNQDRVHKAMLRCEPHIIVDNTNINSSQCKPYVVLAQQHDYKVIFREGISEQAYQFYAAWNEFREIITMHSVPLTALKTMFAQWEPVVTALAANDFKKPFTEKDRLIAMLERTKTQYNTVSVENQTNTGSCEFNFDSDGKFVLMQGFR